MKSQKKYALIVHGKGGIAATGWILWLQEKLEKNKYLCQVPHFPTTSEAPLTEWFHVFEKLNLPLDQTTCIAHARGAMAFLRWVNTLPSNTRIHKLILVSCNSDYQPNRNDSDAFYNAPLNYEDIKQKCPSISIIHSEDDPYVPIAAGEQLATNLNATFVQYKTAGHFGSKKQTAPEILREVIGDTNQ